MDEDNDILDDDELRKEKRQRVKDNILYTAVRIKFKDICPFKNNRGYHPKDPQCPDCSDSVNCRTDTPKRLLTALNNLSRIISDEGFIDDDDWGNGHNYGWEDIDIFDDDWFIRRQDQLREMANDIIEYQIDPNELHQNNRRLFQNCFSEWNKYERSWEKIEIDGSLESYFLDCKRYDTYDFNELINPDLNFELSKQFIKSYIKSQQKALDEEKKKIERIYPFINESKDRWPSNWMLNNKKIRQSIETKKGRFFIALLNQLWNQKMKRMEGKSISEKDVLVIVDREQIADALKDNDALDGISISGQKVGRLIKEFCEIGMLIKVRKAGPRKSTIYAIGTWSGYKNENGSGFKANPFLKESKHFKEALRNL